MSKLGTLGGGMYPLPTNHRPQVVHVIVERPLSRALAFARRTIDDVVNDPIAKREVLGYYKLQQWSRRQCEITDLERWWAGKTR